MRNSYWAMLYAFMIMVAGLIEYHPEFFIGVLLCAVASLICGSIEYYVGHEKVWKIGGRKNGSTYSKRH
jgi:uncharacterized membrane protein